MERNIYLGLIYVYFFLKERIDFVLKMFYVFLSYLHRRSISRENTSFLIFFIYFIFLRGNTSDSCNVCLLWNIYKLYYTQPSMFLCAWIFLYKGKVSTLSWLLSAISSCIGWSTHCQCVHLVNENLF